MKWVGMVMLVLLTASCSDRRSQREAQIAPSASLVIQGGTLIDGTGSNPVENATVIVSDNKIQSIVRDWSGAPPAGARVIDARGKYILPGLIDGHTHYGGYAGPLYLHYGITSIVDTGNIMPWIVVQKLAIQNGLVAGPRIYPVGQMIDNPPPVFLYGAIRSVETVAAAKAAVADQVAKGVNAIKVYKQLRPDLLKAVIEEAHRLGVPVTGHITISAREAVEMGIDSIEHASGVPIATMTDQAKLAEIAQKRYTDTHYLVDHASLPETFSYMKPELFPELIHLFVEKGTFITPTLVCYWMGAHNFSKEYENEDRALLSDPSYAMVPQLDRRWIFEAYNYFGRIKSGEKYQQGYKNLQLFLRQFAENGGKIVAGSDATPYEMFGINLHRELELLVNAGLTPMQALLGATKYAAEKVRKGGEVGSVEPGKYADLLILSANPLEDIRNTKKIDMVIQNGRVLDTTLDKNFIDPLPTPAISKEAISSMEQLLFGRVVSR